MLNLDQAEHKLSATIPSRPRSVLVYVHNIQSHSHLPISGSYHLDWTTAWDIPMPPELVSKCKPLHCELCNCHATSPLQAKLHYEGKTHDKHVRNFFASWSGNTQHRIPQKLPGFEKKAKTALVSLFFFTIIIKP